MSQSIFKMSPALLLAGLLALPMAACDTEQEYSTPRGEIEVEREMDGDVKIERDTDLGASLNRETRELGRETREGLNEMGREGREALNEVERSIPDVDVEVKDRSTTEPGN